MIGVPAPAGATPVDGMAERAGGMRAALAQPWPRWLAAVAAGGSLLAVLVAFLVAVNALRADWAVGGLAAGIAALIIAMLAAGVWMARFVAGQRTYTALAFTLALIVVLASLGVAGIEEMAGIHQLEAAHLEQVHDYQSAIQERELAGETAPPSQGIARDLVAWGEQALAQHQYSQAASVLTTAVALYANGSPSLARANADLYATMRDWLQADGQDFPYASAIQVFETYSASLACDATCEQEAPTLLAQAHFLYGEQLLAAGDDLDAADQMVIVQTKYGSSTYASQAHADAAKAYYAYGKAQVDTPSCAAAVPIYRTLAKSYHDTAEGSAAAKALAQPGRVTGTLTGFSGATIPTLYLSRQIDPSNFYYSDEYSASVNAKSGAFTFSVVAQNAYFFSAVATSQGQYVYTLYHDKSSGQPLVVVVGPLCPTQLGNVPYR